jgi:hypothetical protein
VIYCVVPRELEAELFDRLVAYYADNPGVTVIVDRRTGPDRRRPGAAGDLEREQRIVRDRRRSRGTGSFASTDVADP